MLPLEASYEAIHHGVAGRVVRAEAITVHGPDALSYLQGQCTQDLEALSPGDSAESLLLSPQGKLDAYVRILVRGPEEAVVLVAEGHGEAVLERLRRFKLRIKAEFELTSVTVVELRGPSSGEVAAHLEGVSAIAVDWPGYSGLDLLGLAELPDAVPEGDPGAFEASRIEAGQPLMGSELSERTIPPEAGIVGRTVSFTKGCFTGQELVARLDARGNRVPRNLRAVVLPTESGAKAGDQLVRDGAALGELTSVAYSPGADGLVALAYVRREVEPPATLELGSEEGRVSTATFSADVRELPTAN